MNAHQHTRGFNFHTLNLQDLLEAREAYHIHLSNLPNVVGTAVMNLTGGRLYIHPAQGQTQVLYTDCTFVDHRATWGYAVIGGSDYCAEALATESTTWGRVKELYR